MPNGRTHGKCARYYSYNLNLARALVKKSYFYKCDNGTLQT